MNAKRSGRMHYVETSHECMGSDDFRRRGFYEPVDAAILHRSTETRVSEMDSTQLVQTLKRYGFFAGGIVVLCGASYISPWLFAAVVGVTALVVWVLWYNNPNRGNEDFIE